MHYGKILILASACFLSAFCSYAQQKKNVLVLARKGSEGSTKLAKAYCSAREIPESRILYIDLESITDISREEYNQKIAQPVFEYLVKEKLVKISGENAKFGESFVISSDLDHIVICRPLPYRIKESSPAEDSKGVPGDSASVDSELTMLLRSNYQLKGFYKNPVFGIKPAAGGYKTFTLVSVARLDGIDYSDAGTLFRQAIEAEKNGLRGRAYIDKGYKYPEGEKWLDNSKEIISKLGFDVSLENTRHILGYMDRMDAPVFYFGWYRYITHGYFCDPAFKMPPGASAIHIYSFSARYLRKRNNWAPAFVASGASATFGTVDEPFLIGFCRPDIYTTLLAGGFSAGEAALMATPVLSWKGVFLGDPLFMPFTVSLDEQIRRIDEGKTDTLSQYSIIRKMNLIDAENGRDAAKAFGLKYLDALSCNFALMWKISQYEQHAGNHSVAVKLAKKVLSAAKENFSNYGLAFEVLSYLGAQGYADENVAEYIYLVESAWQGHDDYLKWVLPVLLKDVRFPSEVLERYTAKNLQLNPPAEEKK